MRLTWFFSSLHNPALMSAWNHRRTRPGPTHTRARSERSEERLTLRFELHKCDFMALRCAERTWKAESGEANEWLWCSLISANQRRAGNHWDPTFFLQQEEENKSTWQKQKIFKWYVYIIPCMFSAPHRLNFFSSALVLHPSSLSSSHQKTKGAQTDVWLDVTTVTKRQITGCETCPAAF